jgi:hypothetical protein
MRVDSNLTAVIYTDGWIKKNDFWIFNVRLIFPGNSGEVLISGLRLWDGFVHLPVTQSRKNYYNVIWLSPQLARVLHDTLLKEKPEEAELCTDWEKATTPLLIMPEVARKKFPRSFR